ncbi:MAG: PqqD family protein [Pyrinomonadaceae bacterium]|nr:PqqD family protein [Pyrinomonadaceae bacterium]
MNKLPKARSQKLLTQELEKELLIYDLSNDKAYCLNGTSAGVWHLCDGKNDIGEISKILSERLGVAVDKYLVGLAIDQLAADNLVSCNSGLEPKSRKMSRRQVIRKVGFSSAVALPIVSSLAVPSAGMAQSLLGLNQPCTMGSQCASGNCVNVGVGTACCISGIASGTPPGGAVGIVVPANPPDSCDTTCAPAYQTGGAAANQCCSGNATFAGSAMLPGGVCRCGGTCV